MPRVPFSGAARPPDRTELSGADRSRRNRRRAAALLRGRVTARDVPSGSALGMVSLLAKLFALVPVIATLLPLIPTRSRFVRSGDFPRMQISVLLVLSAAALLAAGAPAPTDWVLLGLCLLCLGVQARYVLPYTPLVRTESARARSCPERRQLRVMIANVLMDNREAGRLLDQVRRQDPDLLFAVETDVWWTERLAQLGNLLPHAAERPQDNYYGMVLRSKLPLSEVRFRTLVQEGVPSLKATVRFPDGRPFLFYGVHPPPPPLQDTGPRDAELLIVARQASHAGLPAIVAGDLNDVGWSSTTRLMRRATGMLDPRIGRGMYATFHADWPLFRWPLDHIFHGPEFALVDLQVGARFGSDHLPVIADLCLRSAPVAGHEPLPPLPEDGAEVAETIRDGLTGYRGPPAFLDEQDKGGPTPRGGSRATRSEGIDPSR